MEKKVSGDQDFGQGLLKKKKTQKPGDKKGIGGETSYSGSLGVQRLHNEGVKKKRKKKKGLS